MKLSSVDTNLWGELTHEQMAQRSFAMHQIKTRMQEQADHTATKLNKIHPSSGSSYQEI